MDTIKDKDLEIVIKRFLEARAENQPGIDAAAGRKKFLRGLHDNCFASMLETNTKEVEAGGVLLRVVQESVPVIDEGCMARLMQWALDNDLADSLLSCRVKAKVWRKMLETGAEVPMVSAVTRAKLEVLGD